MTKTYDINNSLIKKLQRGDMSAAKVLYDNYSKAMYNTLVRLTGNSEEAKDLLQDAFIKAFNNIDSFRGESTFGAWLKRIVINTGLMYLRSKKMEFQEINEALIEQANERDEDTVQIDPAIIHEEIKQLPSGSRAVLSLYLLEGFTHKEIAEELGITESTSKTQYMRGKKLLREHLIRKVDGI